MQQNKTATPATTMPDRYKGKKISVVIPQEIFPLIEKLAIDGDRSKSYIIMKLVKEGLKAQGYDITSNPDESK